MLKRLWHAAKFASIDTQHRALAEDWSRIAELAAICDQRVVALSGSAFDTADATNSYDADSW
jgi:hypothetical protein